MDLQDDPMTSPSGFTSRSKARALRPKAPEIIACPLRAWIVEDRSNDDFDSEEDRYWWLTFQKGTLSLAAGSAESPEELFCLNTEVDLSSMTASPPLHFEALFLNLSVQL